MRALFMALLFLVCVSAHAQADTGWEGKYFSREYFPESKVNFLLVKNLGNGKYSTEVEGIKYVLKPKGALLYGIVNLNAQQILAGKYTITTRYGTFATTYPVAQAAAKQDAFRKVLTLQISGDHNTIMVTPQLATSSFTYKNIPIRNYASDFAIFTLPWQRVPPLSPDFDFAKYVMLHKGNIDMPFREVYKHELLNDNGILKWGGVKGGHNYLIVNPLGKSKLSAEAANQLLRDNVETIFPGKSERVSGDKFEVGAEYRLVSSDSIKTLEFLLPSALVTVNDVETYYFEFKTVPNKHALRGTAKHGILKDDEGELWMFQQGRGPADESIGDAGFAYEAATIMWPRMAQKFKMFLDDNNYR